MKNSCLNTSWIALRPSAYFFKSAICAVALLIGNSGVAAESSATPPDLTNPKQIRKFIEKKCWQCHKLDGRSFVDEVSLIGGQNKEYLVNQLYAFQMGTRKERLLHVMNDIAAKLTDREIDAVAEYYSSQDPVPGHVRRSLRSLSKEEVRLYRIAENIAPMCLTCHGDAEARPAVQPNWPYISGQTRPAIAIQLYAFASGKRKNPRMQFLSQPPFNSPEVLEAMALYFSMQQPPRPMR